MRRMLGNRLNSGLTRRLLTWFLILALVPLFAGGFLAYLESRSALRQDAFARLQAVGAGRRDAIELLLEVRLEQIHQIATKSLVHEVGQDPTPERVQRLITELRDLQAGVPAFTTLAVLNTAGVVVASTNETLIDQSFAGRKEFELARSAVYLDPTFRRDQATGRVVFHVSAAARDPATGELRAVVVGELQTVRINQITTLRNGMGQTGEVYLVNADKLMVTESRFMEGVPLRQPADTFGVREALASRDGAGTYLNYRGQPVVGAYFGMPEYGWVLLAEMDVTEAFAPVQRLTLYMLLIALATVAGVSLIAVWIARSLARPVMTLRDAANALADGDLTPHIHVSSRDEIGELAAAMDTTIAVWREIISDLTQDAARLSSTAAELASSSEELSRTAAAQVDQISRASSAMEQMSAAIQEVARSAHATAQATGASEQRARDGARRAADTAVGLAQADDVLKRLRARSDEIGQIVNLIRDIAAQTNILALNAAIEAAGAGQAGARFDVVAEEIRKLAGRTTQATREIAELIRAVQTEAATAAEAMAEGASLARETGESLADIVEASASVDDMMQVVSSSTRQQSMSSEEIATSLEHIVAASQQTAEATRETAQVGVELSNLAERLRDTAAQFKV